MLIQLRKRRKKDRLCTSLLHPGLSRLEAHKMKDGYSTSLVPDLSADVVLLWPMLMFKSDAKKMQNAGGQGHAASSSGQPLDNKSA